MASVSVMRIEAAQPSFARHHSLCPEDDFNDGSLLFDQQEAREVGAKRNRTQWPASHSSGYTSSSSNVHSRSHSLDIDESLDRESDIASGWSQEDDKEVVVNGWDKEKQRESMASGWSNDRDGATSAWSTRREYSRSDDYRPNVLTLLPLHHLREGSYSRLERSKSNSPTHTRQSSRTSSRQSFQVGFHHHSLPAGSDGRPSHSHTHSTTAAIDHPLRHTLPAQSSGTINSHQPSQRFDKGIPCEDHTSSRGASLTNHSSDDYLLSSASSAENLEQSRKWNHNNSPGRYHALPTQHTHYSDTGMRPHPDNHPPSVAAHPPSHKVNGAVGGSDKTLVASVLEKLEEVDMEVKRWVVKADQHLKRSEYRDAIPFIEAVIVRMQPYHRLQLLLWELLGNAHMAVSNWKKASICHLHHLGYSRALKDFKSVTRAECNLGISYLKLDLLKLASRCFVQYLKNCKFLRDDWGVQAACSNLGVLSKLAAVRAFELAQSCGQMDEEGDMSARAKLNSGLLKAIIFFKQHLEIVLDYEDIDKQSRAYGNIGSCYELLKDYSEAMHYYKKRLELSRAIGDLHSESCTLCHLGNCLRAKGSYEEAMEYYQMNLELAQSLEDVKMEEILHFNLGLVNEKMKQPLQAIVHYTVYLGIVVRCGCLEKQVRGFSVLARLYTETKQLSKAQEYYHNLVGIFKKLGDVSSMKVAQMKSKSLLQLIKQEKKRARKDGRQSYSPELQQHSAARAATKDRSHTISRATNIHWELGGRQYHHVVQDGRGGQSWGGIRRVGNRMGCGYMEGSAGSLARDPGLHELNRQRLGSEADVFGRSSPVSFTSEQTVSQSGSYSTLPSTIAVPPTASQTSWMSRSDMPSRPLPPTPPPRDSSLPSHLLGSPRNDESFGGRYDHLEEENVQANNTTDNFTSVTSASLDNLDSIMATDVPGLQDHTHPISQTAEETEGVEMSETDTSTLYESIHSSRDNLVEVVETRLTDLPSLSYFPSDLGFEVGGVSRDDDLLAPGHTYQSNDEEGHDNDISLRHFDELKQAGLELARVGLDLAGYDGLVGLNGLGLDEGTDKEWEQWKEIKEEELSRGEAFGSSGHSTLERRKVKRNKLLRLAGSAPSLPNRIL